MQTSPPLWSPSQPGAPAAGGSPLAKRCETLGNVALALSALELLSCVQRLLSPLLGRAAMRWQKAFMPKMPRGPSMDEMMDAGRELMDRIAVWEVVRTLPFLIATGVLIAIAVRLRRGDLGALAAARRWSAAALAVVALSAVIQVLVTIPATIDYTRAVVKTMPKLPAGPSGPPFDMGAMMSNMTMISSILGLIGGVLFLSAWPIVLYVWAGRIERAAESPEASLGA